jgi:hypothetical protein
MPTVRTLQHSVTFNGSTLDNVLSFRYALGFDEPVGSAQITLGGWTSPGVLMQTSSLGTYFDEVSIRVDNIVRWSGIFLQWDFSLFPRQVTMQCKGRLEYANRYKLPIEAVRVEDKGLLLEDFVSGDTTDENIVSAVLSYISLSTRGGAIDGTGRIYGTIANQEFVWAVNESALSYIQKIDGVSAGYRTFESADGQIYRASVTSRPSGSPELTFTEGVDIKEASASRTVQNACNGVRIGGYSVGDYADPRVWLQIDGNDFMDASNPQIYSYDNSMIERRAEASSGTGMSCERMAEFWLGELNREVVTVQMTTPRSDLIGPAQIHLVQGPGGQAYRIGVGEPLWVQRVEGTLDASGAFSQTMTYIGGGI